MSLKTEYASVGNMILTFLLFTPKSLEGIFRGFVCSCSRVGNTVPLVLKYKYKR